MPLDTSAPHLVARSEDTFPSDNADALPAPAGTGGHDVGHEATELATADAPLAPGAPGDHDAGHETTELATAGALPLTHDGSQTEQGATKQVTMHAPVGESLSSGAIAPALTPAQDDILLVHDGSHFSRCRASDEFDLDELIVRNEEVAAAYSREDLQSMNFAAAGLEDLRTPESTGVHLDNADAGVTSPGSSPVTAPVANPSIRGAPAFGDVLPASDHFADSLQFVALPAVERQAVAATGPHDSLWRRLPSLLRRLLSPTVLYFLCAVAYVVLLIVAGTKAATKRELGGVYMNCADTMISVALLTVRQVRFARRTELPPQDGARRGTLARLNNILERITFRHRISAPVVILIITVAWVLWHLGEKTSNLKLLIAAEVLFKALPLACFIDLALAPVTRMLTVLMDQA